MPQEVIKRVGFTEVFALNRTSKAPIVVNVGGAGSSKSYSIAQLLVYKFINEENKVFGIVRKTFPALRMTAMGLILDLFKEYGVYKEGNHNKTSNTYIRGSNIIWFFSVDEADKIKSTNFSYLWVEEANELSWEEYIILKLRLRAPVKEGEANQICLSCNPSDSFNWIAKKVCGVGLSCDN